MGCNSCGYNTGCGCGCGNNWWWIIILILVWLWFTGGNATNISAYRTCGRRYSALTNSYRGPSYTDVNYLRYEYMYQEEYPIAYSLKSAYR